VADHSSTLLGRTREPLKRRENADEAESAPTDGHEAVTHTRMEKNCVILPTHPLHYAEAHANLLSMLRFATDAVLPRVFVVLDREDDRRRLRGGRFPPACEDISSAETCAALASFVHTMSLEGLLEARGEGLRTQPHINATLDAAFDAWHAGCLKARDAAVCDHPSWRLDFFKPVPRASWLGHGGHPRVAVPRCHGADFLSWKRKYQAIKKLYASEAAATAHGCDLLWP
jgi:hypothetical protein